MTAGPRRKQGIVTGNGSITARSWHAVSALVRPRSLAIAAITALALALTSARSHASFLANFDQNGSAGLGQRMQLLIVHGWVLLCAAALILEASPGWPPTEQRSNASDLVTWAEDAT